MRLRVDDGYLVVSRYLLTGCVHRRLPGRNEWQLMRDVFMAVDAGLIFIRKIGGMHILRAHALAREIHGLADDNCGIPGVIAFESRPFVLR